MFGNCIVERVTVPSSLPYRVLDWKMTALRRSLAMMRGIVRSSLNFRYLVVVLAAVLMVVGVSQIGAMPVDVLPELSPPYVEIQTEALGLSAEEVEQMITVPMEQDLLAGGAWAGVLRSEFVPGLL